MSPSSRTSLTTLATKAIAAVLHRVIARLVPTFAAAIGILSFPTAGELVAADKYALLVAVAKYEHPEMNAPQLVYPEADARELQKLLESSGYQVDLLAGKSATQQAIVGKLRSFGDRGGGEGVIVVGVFGHGIEFASDRKSYFCPYDAPVRALRDSKGNLLNDDQGQPKFEPARERLVAIDEVLIALRESKAAHRVLLADCCRNDPNAARGRTFGSSLETNQLPKNAAVLFACSEGQKAYEHQDWQHGAFSKVLLEVLRQQAAAGKTTMGTIAEEVVPAVEKLTQAKLRDDDKPQTPRILLTGGRVDLMLSPSRIARPSPLRAPFTPTEAARAQQSWADYLGLPKSKRDPVTGATLALIPPGHFTMGSPPNELDRSGNEKAHPVQLTAPYYLGIHEVTVGQFRKFVQATDYKTEAEKDGEGGYGWNESTGQFEGPKPSYAWRNAGFPQTDSHPVLNITWNDAQAFCAWLRRETGVEYRLPTEAEWEFGCRAGTTTAFWNGEDADAVTKVGNISDATAKAKLTNYGNATYSTGSDGYVFTAPVGSFPANAFGLHDTHGNVWERCQDVFDAYDRQPSVNPMGGAAQEREYRVFRGGSFDSPPKFCRSACRKGAFQSRWDRPVGFRLALVAGAELK